MGYVQPIVSFCTWAIVSAAASCMHVTSVGDVALTFLFAFYTEKVFVCVVKLSTWDVPSQVDLKMSASFGILLFLFYFLHRLKVLA